MLSHEMCLVCYNRDSPHTKLFCICNTVYYKLYSSTVFLQKTHPHTRLCGVPSPVSTLYCTPLYSSVVQKRNNMKKSQRNQHIVFVIYVDFMLNGEKPFGNHPEQMALCNDYKFSCSKIQMFLLKAEI